jgi:hypothetical protein
MGADVAGSMCRSIMPFFVPEDVQLVIFRMASEMSFRATVETIADMHTFIIAKILQRHTDLFHTDPRVAKLSKVAIRAVYSKLLKLRWLSSRHNATGNGLKALGAIAIQKDIDFIFR